jgi:hypothetical protein
MRVARHWSLTRDDALDAYQRALEIYVRRLDSLDPTTEIAWLKSRDVAPSAAGHSRDCGKRLARPRVSGRIAIRLTDRDPVATPSQSRPETNRLWRRNATANYGADAHQPDTTARGR